MADNEITTRQLSDSVIEIRTGRVLDNHNANVMVDLITRAQAEGNTHIVVNMSTMEFLSSAGVGSILGTVEISRETGGDIILCCVPPMIMHVLQVLDLHEYLTIETSVEEAAALCGVS